LHSSDYFRMTVKSGSTRPFGSGADRKIPDQLNDIADALRSQLSTPVGDWLAQYLAGDGDVLNTDEAAFILGCHRDTVRSYAERAARTRKPIAILVAGAAWLFSEKRLLDSIEAECGRHERLVAETRAAEMRKLRHKTKIERPVRIETERRSVIKRAEGVSSPDAEPIQANTNVQTPSRTREVDGRPDTASIQTGRSKGRG
jgi:hypothetical protein